MLIRQLALHIGDTCPAPVWQDIAYRYQWELIHHDTLQGALGTYVVLMPSIIIIDLTTAVGRDVHRHLTGVLSGAPQRILLITLTSQESMEFDDQHIYLHIPADHQTIECIVSRFEQIENIQKSGKLEQTGCQ